MELMTSPVLKAMNTQHSRNQTTKPLSQGWSFHCPKNGDYRIHVAATSILRNKARSLVNRIYSKRGYSSISDDYNHNKVQIPDYTLLAINSKGDAAGSVSLNLDNPDGLPSDEIFKKEVENIRIKGKKIAEVTGFAISETHACSKALLVHLLDFIFIIARRECPDGTVVIEVNPRHENYYQKLMNFKIAGPVRSCARVQGAPARLLRLELAQQHAAIRLEAGRKNNRTTNNRRSLYKHFYTLEEEVLISRFLMQSS